MSSYGLSLRMHETGSLRVTIAVAAVLALLAVLNLQYFWQQVKFLSIKPMPETQQQVSLSPAQKYTPNRLSIESLGIESPIIYTNKNSENDFQEALQNGVVHYPGTANPGESGNCYIFGHSSDYVWSKGNYKTVFALLPRIEKGAQIKITDQQGNMFTYTVTDSFVTSAKDMSVLDQGDKSKKTLTLQTSYPLGTALKRWIVKAEIK